MAQKGTDKQRNVTGWFQDREEPCACAKQVLGYNSYNYIIPLNSFEYYCWKKCEQMTTGCIGVLSSHEPCLVGIFTDLMIIFFVSLSMLLFFSHTDSSYVKYDTSFLIFFINFY